MVAPTFNNDANRARRFRHTDLLLVGMAAPRAALQVRAGLCRDSVSRRPGCAPATRRRAQAPGEAWRLPAAAENRPSPGRSETTPPSGCSGDLERSGQLGGRGSSSAGPAGTETGSVHDLVYGNVRQTNADRCLMLTMHTLTRVLVAVPMSRTFPTQGYPSVEMEV